MSHIHTLIMIVSTIRTPLLPILSKLEARIDRFVLFNLLFSRFNFIVSVLWVIIVFLSRKDELYGILGIFVKVQISAAPLPWEPEARDAGGGFSAKVGFHGHKALSVPLDLVVVIQELALLELSLLPAVDWDLVRAVMVVMVDVGISSSTAMMTCLSILEAITGSIVGGFRSIVGRFWSTVGGFRYIVGRFRCNVGGFRRLIGRFRS